MIRFAQPADFKTLYAEGFQPSGQRYSRMRHTVLKTGRSRTRPKTGIRLKKDSAVGMKPAKRHQKPYVSTSIPTIAQPHTTRPTPRRKNALPCTQIMQVRALVAHYSRVDAPCHLMSCLGVSRQPSCRQPLLLPYPLWHDTA